MLQETSYHFSEWSVVETVVKQVQQQYSLEEQPVHTICRTFLDSFDWRLYSAGKQLWVEQTDSDMILCHHSIKTSSTRKFVSVETIPKTLNKLPESPLQKALCKLLDMRVLLPQIEVKSTVYKIHLVDAEKKTILRLLIEESSQNKTRSRRLILQPIRGYSKPFKQVKKILKAIPELAKAKQSLFEEFLAAEGKKPCNYSSKINFHFAPDCRSDVAAKVIHLHLLTIVKANIPGVAADLDSEFLHDMRVAIRRMRSALTQIKGVFGAADVERFKSRLAWVGQVTGPSRDLDVYLLRFDNYQTCLPEKFRDDLGPLYDFLVKHKEIEHQKMLKKLRSPFFHSLVKELRVFMEDTDTENDAPKAAMPILTLSNKRIFKMYCRIMEHGLAIEEDTPAEYLHDLRKNCKKLRYLMEFFRNLYPQKKITRLIKSVKTLLDNLGDFQDLEVQAYTIGDYAKQMSREEAPPHNTLLAMGMLVDKLLLRQQQVRGEFIGRFSTFSKPENQRIFKELFAQTSKKGNN